MRPLCPWSLALLECLALLGCLLLLGCPALLGCVAARESPKAGQQDGVYARCPAPSRAEDNPCSDPPMGQNHAGAGENADTLSQETGDGSDSAMPLSESAAWDAGMPGGVAPAMSSLYPEVEAIIHRSCGIDRCHQGVIIGAGLYFGKDADVRDVLVNVSACEYERMALVEPGSPERSWMWVKLTAPFRPPLDPYATYIEFEPPTDWDPTARGCPDVSDDGVPLFGQRMPATAPNSLPPQELELIRRWIEEGARP